MTTLRWSALLLATLLATHVRAAVPTPTITGPITSPGGAFITPPSGIDLSQFGWVEQEFFVAGTARAYRSALPLGADGNWTATPDGATAPYKTRILVRRPTSPRKFNGTVIVEWLNVSGGLDAAPDWTFLHPFLKREGYAWIGVSAQFVGVEGGSSPLGLNLSLKAVSPARYGSLSHPGDSFSYDMFSQVGQALRSPTVATLLDGLAPRRVIAIGESQSAFRMTTYVNAIHPDTHVYDGFLIHSRGGGGAPLVDSQVVLGEGVARIRDDVDVPVLQFLTETDLFSVLGFHSARQDDSDNLRTWEVAGTAHADRSILDYNAQMARDVAGGGFDLAAECGSINEGSQAHVLRAAVAGLRAWVVDGEPPPQAPPLDVEGQAIARDERGIALGGIRTPAVDAPISVLTGEAPPGRSVLCLLFGDTRPFDAATVAALYPTHQDYVDAVTESADAAVAAGFLRQAEADDIVAAAGDADVPS